ncbi:MAG: radical SAM protein [Polyangiaceae bacterium]
MNIVFLVQHGDAGYGLFDDTFVSLLCADARRDGVDATVLHVFFTGERETDLELRRLVRNWMEARSIRLVVVERAVDTELVAQAAQDGRRVVLVTRGDSLDPVPGAEFIVGALPGLTSSGRVARTPPVEYLRFGFRELRCALGRGEPGDGIPGVSSVQDGVPRPGIAVGAGPGPWPFDPVLDHEVIALRNPEPVEHKTLLGNVGCPFASDPFALPHYAGVEIKEDVGLSRLGCAFCPMGGDYQVRSDAVVVEDLVKQARWFLDGLPGLRALVISDQAPLRYLPALMDAAASLRASNWLFPARADALLREEAALRRALASARQSGHFLECYLVGFEAFCQRELDRYNKGSSVETLLRAVDLLRSVRREFPQQFAYARTRGHSLVLFNPWTTPEDLLESADVMRRHGLNELFDEPTRNRLRLYRDLPITYAAARDGALAASDNPGSGAGRAKGYSAEIPWRFLDERTAEVTRVLELLQRVLGPTTVLPQLIATARAGGASLPDAPTFAAELDGLVQCFAGLLADGRHPGLPPRARTQSSTAVLFAGECNNGCEACANRDAFLADDVASLEERVDAARQSGNAIALAGREPTLHPALLQLLRRARGSDERAVGIVSNGRRFGYADFTTACVASGLRAASLKLFASDPIVADGLSRVPGGFEQALAGARNLARLGIPLELRVPLLGAVLHRLPGFVDLAEELQASLRLELSLDGLGLERLGAAHRSILDLLERAAKRGVAVEAAPPAAGTRDFRFLPA